VQISLIVRRAIVTHDYTSEECKRFATECLESLKVTFDPNRRAELLKTAKDWLRRAESDEGAA
jgi:hypothetical protein